MMKSNKFPALYHGTDARIVKMTDDERRQYLNHCENVIDYLFPFYDELATTFEQVQEEYQGEVRFSSRCLLDTRFKDNIMQIPHLYMGLHNSIISIQARNRGNGQYQYGSFYLSSMRQMAINYAIRSFAGGELGFVAYRFIQGLECVEFSDYHPSQDIVHSMDIIKDFASDESQHAPVLFTFKDVDINFLQDDKGNPLPPDFDDYDIGRAFRYINDVHLSLDDAEYLKKI